MAQGQDYGMLTPLLKPKRSHSLQESPHEREQSLLLTRIITNVVSMQGLCSETLVADSRQEKLNEAVLEMNKKIQVGIPGTLTIPF